MQRNRPGTLILFALLSACHTLDQVTTPPAAAPSPVAASPAPAAASSSTPPLSSPAATASGLPAAPDPKTATRRQIRRYKSILKAASKAQARVIEAAVPAPPSAPLMQIGSNNTKEKARQKVKAQHKVKEKPVTKSVQRAGAPWWLWLILVAAACLLGRRFISNRWF